ncbi:MAG: DNA-binding response regulator [Calditrichaeota bacterium]|nr:DNA-binding response regulator [Calditrichota bacterium]
MFKLSLRYGSLLALMLVLFKTIEYSFFAEKITLDLYLGIVALFFLVIGSFIGLRMRAKHKEKVAITIELNQTDLLSERECEVLKLMAEGCTNQEIADRLFVSINTTKTHLKHIFEKLNVTNRTQAVIEARRLQILA